MKFELFSAVGRASSLISRLISVQMSFTRSAVTLGSEKPPLAMTPADRSAARLDDGGQAIRSRTDLTRKCKAPGREWSISGQGLRKVHRQTGSRCIVSIPQK